MKDIRPGLLESDRVYSAKALAKALHVSVRTIYNLASRSELPFVKITPKSDMRFPGWQIKQWLDTKTEGCKKYEKNGDLRTGETEEVKDR